MLPRVSPALPVRVQAQRPAVAKASPRRADARPDEGVVKDALVETGKRGYFGLSDLKREAEIFFGQAKATVSRWLGKDAPAVHVPGKAVSADKVPHIYQIRPEGTWPGYTNGDMNCGPSSLAMIARYFGKGQGLSDARLVDRLNRVDGDFVGGTQPRELEEQAEALGLDCRYKPGPDTNWIAEELRRGHKVIVRGSYRKGGSGHLMVVAGIDAKGNFLVHDPWRKDGRSLVFSPQQLKDYMANHSTGGGQYAVKPAG